MPVVILGGLYGGLFTPTEAAAPACGYAMVYGLIVGRGEFIRQLLPTAMRAMNLTGVILFLIGSVGVFQFLAANMYWPQRITDTITGWGLSPLGFIFAYMGVLLILGMFVDGVAMILLTVPVIFPVAYAMKIDPVALGIMLTLNIEMGVVTPPVGLNLFAVSGTSKISLPEVIKGTLPFFVGDGIVLLLDLFPGARHLAARPARQGCLQMKKSGKPGRNSASTKTKARRCARSPLRASTCRASKRPAERSKQTQPRLLTTGACVGAGERHRTAPQSSGSTERTRWPIAHMT